MIASHRVENVLTLIIAALDRLTKDLASNPPNQERLFRRTFREIIAALDTLSDDEQYELIAPTAPAPLGD